VHAVDISRDVIEVGERGIYSPEASAMVGTSIFEGLSEGERLDIFDWQGEQGRVKPWLRDGITWEVGDANDPELPVAMGAHDLVVANNFLCHLDAQNAERCLRNLVRLVGPGGFLFVTGVDLDVRTKVALDLRWEPVSELRTEAHYGDPLVCADWPFHWWGLEPFDETRPEWETRYASVFQIDAKLVESESPAVG